MIVLFKVGYLSIQESGMPALSKSFSSADIIFFIYLYQKWIYPIDLKRVNEFGVTGEELAGKVPSQDDNVKNGNAITANGETVSDKKKD